jgi:hypothetical protein
MGLHRPPLPRRRRSFFSVHRFLRESVQPSQFLFLQHAVSSYLQGCQLNSSARKNEEQVVGRVGGRLALSRESAWGPTYRQGPPLIRRSACEQVNGAANPLPPVCETCDPAPIYCRPCHQFTADNPSRLVLNVPAPGTTFEQR